MSKTDDREIFEQNVGKLNKLLNNSDDGGNTNGSSK